MDFEYQYALLVQEILDQTALRETRNANTKAIFGRLLAVDTLRKSQFPILYGRKMFWKGVAGELATFLQGPEHIKDFKDNGCNFWNQWADDDGTLTLDYGNAWTDFNGVNQLKDVVESLKTNPHGRRHVISAWRPDRLKDLSLPCCHYAYQWFVDEDDWLHMIWIQRSVDTMIGLPSDIVSAAIFNILMAQTTRYHPGRITLQLGDTHIYEDHLDAAKTYVDRVFYENLQNYSSWTVDPEATVFNFKPSMFEVTNYHPMGALDFNLIA